MCAMRHDMSHSHETAPIHMRHDPFICVTWLIYVRHEQFTRDSTHPYVTALIHMWHDSFMCDIIHSCATWPIQMWQHSFIRDMTPSYVTWLIHTWHDSMIRDHMCVSVYTSVCVCVCARARACVLRRLWHTRTIHITHTDKAFHTWVSHVTCEGVTSQIWIGHVTWLILINEDFILVKWLLTRGVLRDNRLNESSECNKLSVTNSMQKTIWDGRVT